MNNNYMVQVIKTFFLYASMWNNDEAIFTKRAKGLVKRTENLIIYFVDFEADYTFALLTIIKFENNHFIEDILL